MIRSTNGRLIGLSCKVACHDFRTNFVTMLLAICAWNTVLGQDEAGRTPADPGSPPTVEPRSGSNPETGATPREGGSRIVLQTDDGKLIPLRDLGFPITFLKDLTERAALQTEVPLAEVTQVEITGEIRDDKLRFDAHLRVRVTVDNEWVSVPVGFDEAQLVRKSYQGETEQHAVMYDSNSTNKQQWYLKGRGIHDLRLSMIHQFRRGPQGRDRIRLTVPPSPTSHLTLTIDQPVTPQQPSTGAAITSEITGERTAIEMWGFSPALELEWQPLLATADATSSLRSTERIRLDLATQPISMSVTQSVRVRDGAYDQLSVTLPLGMKLERVSARNENGEVPVRTEPASPEGPSHNRVVLAFPERLANDTEVIWELGAVDESLPETLDLRLLQIDQATDQTGDVQILVPGGINVIPEAASIGIRRRRGSRATEPGGATTAYQLLSNDSRLLLRTEELPAFYTVEPHILLQPSETQMTMICRFVVRVERGSVQELIVDWPAELNENWRPVAASSSDSAQPVIIHSVDSNDLRLRFPSRQSDDFTVELQAIRDQPELTGRYEVRLPDIRSAGRHAVILMLGDSDEVGVEITTNDDDLIPTTIDAEGVFADDEEATPKVRNAWILPDSSTPLNLLLTPQDPITRRRTFATIVPQGDSLLYHQEIEYSVEHRDLEEIRLIVPVEIIPTVRLKETGDVLQPASGGNRGWVYRLPQESRRGRFTVEVEYAVPLPKMRSDPEFNALPDSDPGLLRFPIITSDKADFERVEVGVRDSSQMELVHEEGWTPLHSKDYPSMFLIPEDATEFSARWLPANITSGAGIKLRAQIGFAELKGARASVRQAWIVESPPGDATITLPAGCEIVSCRIDEREARPVFPASGENTERGSADNPPQHVNIHLPRRGADPSDQRYLIRLDILRPFEVSHSPFRMETLPLPELHTENSSCRTLWYIRCDQSTAIMNSPESLTDGNQFGFGFPLLHRRPVVNVADPQTWLRTVMPESGIDVTELSPWRGADDGSETAFEGYAAIDTLRLTRMSLGFALLIGAGFSLVLTIVLIRYRPAPIGLIVCAFGILASVTEAIVPGVLLQLLPAILGGFMLAAMAIVVDRILRPAETANQTRRPSARPVKLLPAMIAPTVLQSAADEPSNSAAERIMEGTTAGAD